MIKADKEILACVLIMQQARSFIWKITTLTLCLMLLTACGSTPLDESRFKNVQTQIDDAREIESDQHAADELHAAQEKLKDAHTEDKNGNREKALRLLKEAELHAQLAQSRAMTARSQKALEKINAGLEALQNELNR